MRPNIWIACFSLCLLTACADNWSTSSIQQTDTQKSFAKPVIKKLPSQILITEGDITDRPYRVIGDISLTVNKMTLGDDDPTPEVANEKLREEAVEIGADAVILVRYGTVGIGLMSWGSLDVKGRAIAFTQ